jgi:hypothetical protein
MAEGLAAIGLAGNIIQFISFGSALVSKSREFHQSASGISTELVDLELVSRNIKRLNAQILAKINTSTELCDVAKSCNAIADQLLGAISEIRNDIKPSHRTPTRWRSFRKALKCIWKKEQIEDLKSRLVLLRDQVALHVVSDTR